MMRDVVVRKDREKVVRLLKEKVQKVFDRFLAGRRRSDARERAERETWLPGLFTPGWPAPAGLFEGFFDAEPAVDVIDEDDALRVVAEVPGLSHRDLKVRVGEREVFIEGEKKSSREEKRKGYLYSECSYGAFSRVVPLPCPVDRNKAKALCRNGVLELRIPKDEAFRPRRIAVKAA